MSTLGRSQLLACVLFMGLIAACGNSTSSPGAGPGTSPRTAQPAECAPVSMAMGKAILSGSESGRLTPVGVAAYRSPDFKRVFFVAVRFTVPGADQQTGVWATSSLTPGRGLILAVEGFAQQFTTWPDADNTDAHIESTDPGVDRAEACLQHS